MVLTITSEGCSKFVNKLVLLLIGVQATGALFCTLMSNVLKPVMSKVYRPAASVPRFTAFPPFRSTLTLSAVSLSTNSHVLPVVFRTSDAYGVAEERVGRHATSPDIANNPTKRFSRIVSLPSTRGSFLMTKQKQ